MKDFRESKWCLPVCALFFIVQSCAGTKDRQSPHRPVEKPARAAISAEQHMAAGRYQKAIDEYTVERRSRPRDQALVQKYAKSLEEIKAVADKALDTEAFASAGTTYDVLLKNYSCFTGFAGMLSFDREHLITKLSLCRKSLSTQGFQEYRKGNLGEAIALWQSLLAFDPYNADIKAAVKTATLQQKNLQDTAAGR